MPELDIPYLKIVEQSQQMPNAIAVLQGDIQLTYAQLDRRSNQIAQYLRTQSIDRGSRVGIMTERGPLMLIGILGILKAGGAYVPIDPAYPVDRIRYILDHAEIQILLSEQAVVPALSTCLSEPITLQSLVLLDESASHSPDDDAARNTIHPDVTQISSAAWSTAVTTAPAVATSPDDVMTVLYTSGSTGRPKGVMLTHRGYMNRLTWMQKTFQLRYGDRVAQKTSFCFDISVWELFWPLMTGATICPVKQETVLNPWEFAEWIKTTRIQVMHFVPSLFGEFVNALAHESWSFPDLRWLIFSGEALPAAFIQQWIDQQGTDTGLANLYGPTEASIDVTAHLITSRPAQSIPIGKAIDNVYIRLLDAQMQPVPVGKLGELWIGGVQLAQGYLKQPERTAAAFRPNPFADIPGKTLYRSGDLAKALPDGTIEYHGRIDHQIKIRGFRVELGEIENVLMLHPAIHEAAVLAIDYESGQKRLIAGVVGAEMPARDLKLFLAKKLPHYMVPARIEWLPNLPKNHNGKLDRKALQTLLDQPAHPSEPSDLSLSAIEAETEPPLFPLAPAQRWIVSYFSEPYQWSGYTRFRYQKALDVDRFNQAFNQIIRQHPAMRMVFHPSADGQWQQQLITPDPVQVVVSDGSYFTPEQCDRYIKLKIQQTVESLHLNTYPLFALFVLKVHDTCYDITMVAHHMIADMIASSVLFNNIWDAYDRLANTAHLKPAAADEPTSDYLSYLEYLKSAEQRGELMAHIDYWKAQFPTKSSAFQLPFDAQGENTEASAAIERFSLSSNSTEILLQDAKQRYSCSVYELLLAPLYKLLANWAKEDQVIVSHRSHGRDLRDSKDNSEPEAEKVFWKSFGNFAVNFPVGIAVASHDSWPQLIEKIRQQFDSLPMNGVTYDWIGSQLPGHLYPDEKLTPVRANYLGNRSLVESEVFEFDRSERDRRLAAATQKRTTLLEFFFSVNNGILELEIEYSQNFHHSTTIQQIGQQYIRLVKELLSIPVQAISRT